MPRKENVEKAIKLVDKLRGLSDKKREILKKQIAKAAEGDEAALTDIILFPYNSKDRAIFSEILLLMLRKGQWSDETTGGTHD